jgi:hypothetical protein
MPHHIKPAFSLDPRDKRILLQRENSTRKKTMKNGACKEPIQLREDQMSRVIRGQRGTNSKVVQAAFGSIMI